MRLIDADALIKVVNDDIDRCYLLGFGRISGAVGPLCHFVDEINDQPTINAAPVVHARWEDDRMHYRCSNCSGLFTDDILFINGVDGDLPKYCPACGAKMDGGAE